MAQYTLGIDFGTESGRALLVDVTDGCEVASAVHPYRHGVIDEQLPESGIALEPEWALQDPADYLAVLQQAVPAALGMSGVDPADVIGIGIDFTACTMVPVKADGTPLCRLPEYRRQPHAWVKLWKHHAAQPEANRINRLAAERGEPWLPFYGGKTSSEWFFSKALQILDEAPLIYHAADRLIEAGDWLVWQLTGHERRSACFAGFKALWQKDLGFPSHSFLAALHPAFADVVDAKMSRHLQRPGERVGGLRAEAAAWMGLRPGTPVASPIIDAHAAVLAGQATQPGDLLLILGTSTCHLAVADVRIPAPGIAGVVEDGILPGLFGYEAGQSATGDILAWFVRTGVPPALHEAARQQGVTLYAYLEAEAAQQQPGEHGLLALDWWNGVRSPLMDAELSGLVVGLTLATTPAEIYRALIEATAYGTRWISQTFAEGGLPIQRVIAAGGLAEQNRLLLQIYADVLNQEVQIVRSGQASALGAAILGAVAAGSDQGGYDEIQAAVTQMGGLKGARYRPQPEQVALYDQLYADYRQLAQFFGERGHGVMGRLRNLRRAAHQRINMASPKL
jgi:L-ribulokinase